MCNKYEPDESAEEINRRYRSMNRTGNEPWDKTAYPNSMAPIIRHGEEGPELVVARWGMPSPSYVLKTARDPGVTNVRNLSSRHWKKWLGKQHRCLVPVKRFAEPLGKGRGDQWFAHKDERPMFFAGIEVRGWTSVRKVKDGETTDDLYAFLTCKPNAEVEAIHDKAMPVILTEEDEFRAWMDGIPADELQRPLLDGSLELVARSEV